MHDWEYRSIKISNGSIKSLRYLNRLLEDEDFNNVKIINEAIIMDYISRLRKKLGKKRILTRRGQGYLFNPEKP